MEILLNPLPITLNFSPAAKQNSNLYWYADFCNTQVLLYISNPLHAGITVWYLGGKYFPASCWRHIAGNTKVEI